MENEQTSLVQKSSFGRRIVTTFAVAILFFSLKFFVTFFWNQHLLKSLTDVYGVQKVSFQMKVLMESLEESGKVLRRFQTVGKPKEIQEVYDTHLTNLKGVFEDILPSLTHYGANLKELERAKEDLKKIEDISHDLFSLSIKSGPESSSFLNSQLALEEQFRTEVIESLSHVRIFLQDKSFRIFEDFYARRHQPLILSGVLSVLFSLILFVMGIKLIRHLSHSIRNLLGVTQEVSHGNFLVKADILEADELGVLTDRFNKMIQTLKKTTVSVDLLEQKNKELSESHQQLTGLHEVLMDREERFRFVVETARDGIISANSEGKIVFCNKGAQDIFGYSPEEMMGSPLTLLMPQRFQSLHLRGFKRYLDTGESRLMGRTIEIEGIKKDRSEFPIEISLSNWSLKGQQFFTAIIRDVTDRKRAEEFQRISEMKTAFISVVSHELRTPLTSIMAAIDLLIEGIDGPINAPQQETLGIAKNNIERLSRLVSNILDYTKLESGKMDITFEKVNLKDVVTEAYHFMKPLFLKKGVDFSLQVPPKKLLAFCDSDKIEQVIGNLVDNAMKYTEPRGKVFLRLSSDKDHVKIEVEDTGIGIPKEEQEAIFEMFRQGGYRGMWKTGGTGVGLAVCRLIMEQHQGHISVKSEFGKGSCFLVTFPLDLAVSSSP